MEENSCGCADEETIIECEMCRAKFVWVDESLPVADFWIPSNSLEDPTSGERCVRLRHPFFGQNAWSGEVCGAPLTYICKAGTFWWLITCCCITTLQLEFTNAFYFIDIDECFRNMHGCFEGSTCVNIYGSYECDCPRGLTGDLCDQGCS